MILIKNILFVISVSALIGCSADEGKNILFGSSLGPDPFVIGSTLKPLQSVGKSVDNFSGAKTAALPKPKAILSAAQMPSRAKKASEILNIPVNNASEKLADNVLMADHKSVDFNAFDQQMTKIYAKQSHNGRVLSSIFGNDSVDPTTREKNLKE